MLYSDQCQINGFQIIVNWCIIACTVLFLINAGGACNFLKRGHLLQVNFELKICDFLVQKCSF